MAVKKEIHYMGHTFQQLARKAGSAAGPSLRYTMRKGPAIARKVARKMKPIPYARGRYMQGFRVELTDKGAILKNVSRIAQFVEDGRRAGARMPPLAPIQRWMKVKGIEGGRGGAYLIARSISRRGIKARPVIKKALIELRKQAIVDIKRRMEKLGKL